MIFRTMLDSLATAKLNSDLKRDRYWIVITLVDYSQHVHGRDFLIQHFGLLIIACSSLDSFWFVIFSLQYKLWNKHIKNSVTHIWTSSKNYEWRIQAAETWTFEDTYADIQGQMKRPPKCVKNWRFIQITVKFIVENITDTGSAASMMQK